MDPAGIFILAMVGALIAGVVLVGINRYDDYRRNRRR